MLRIDGLSGGYGRIAVLREVTLEVARGSVVALVGANGAGKTTLLRAISGVHPVSKGTIALEGRELNGVSAANRVRLGIAQVPEGRLVFGPLSVEDNLLLGGFTRTREIADRVREDVFNLFPILRERRSAAAGSLSGGEQQMLAIGRALMSAPKLLLLDEPSLGLAPLVVSLIFDVIRKLNRSGMTVLIVEQNAMLALEIADDAYVLETGHISARGTGAELLQDEAVRSAYLGV